jgi:hypothetical protein
MMPEDYLGAVESRSEQWPLTEPLELPGARSDKPDWMSIFEEQQLNVLVEDLDPSLP